MASFHIFTLSRESTVSCILYGIYDFTQKLISPFISRTPRVDEEQPKEEPATSQPIVEKPPLVVNEINEESKQLSHSSESSLKSVKSKSCSSLSVLTREELSSVPDDDIKNESDNSRYISCKAAKICRFNRGRLGGTSSSD